MRISSLFIFIIFFFAIHFSAVAAGMGPPPVGGGGGGAPGCWPPGPACTVPIDGGITLLIAAGLAYGGRKTLQLRKK